MTPLCDLSHASGPRRAPRDRDGQPDEPAREASDDDDAGVEPFGRVLVVDDEPAIGELVVRRLERKGYRVLTAHDGQEALEVVARHTGRIDLMVTDVVMPRMDGFALEGHLTAEFPSLKVLFMTGYADWVVTVRGGLEELGWPVLLKPFMPADLEAAVQKALSAPSERGNDPRRRRGHGAADRAMSEMGE